MLPQDQKLTYDSFFKATAENDILDSETTTLIQLAASLALGCYPCMDHYLGVAREKGLTDEQIGAVQSIVMAISAGRVRAQFREVRENMD